MKELSKSSKVYKLGQYVFLKGGVLREDFLLYASTVCAKEELNEYSYVYGHRILKKLIDRGLVCLGEIYLGPKQGKKTKAITVCTTVAGKELFSQGLPPSQVEYASRMYDVVSMHNQKKLEMTYNQNHVRTMFDSIGIKTVECLDKLPLDEVWKFRKLSDEHKGLKSNESTFASHTEGAYYSKEEFRVFYEKYYKDSEIFSSVFRGLYLSNDKCIVVYSNGRFNNHMIYAGEAEREDRLIRKLRQILNYSEVYALTMSDTESFIYATAEGRTRGRHKDDEINRNNTLNVLYTQKLFDETIKFDKFYCVVNGKEGLKTLKQILTYDEDVEYDNCTERNPKLELAHRGARAPLTYNDKGIKKPCYYLPFYELTTLTLIAKDEHEEPPIIITYEELRDVIQHITHKQHLFIDADTYRPLSKIDSTIYDSNGNPKGLKMLLDYLHEQGVTIPPKVIRELPKEYDKDYIEFYNYIALKRDGYDIDDIANKLTEDNLTIPYAKKRYRKRKKKTIMVSADSYAKLKAYAKSKHYTLYHATNKLISQMELPDDVTVLEANDTEDDD